MSDFNFDLFTKPDQYEETLLRDRKWIIEYWTNKGKADFIPDVIALANTARMVGKPAYLILGMSPKDTDEGAEVLGIKEMIEYQKSRGADSDATAFDRIKREMGDIFYKHITPILSPPILFSHLDGKPLGYVCIPPRTHPEPYTVKKEVEKGLPLEDQLHKGNCFLRFGESKREVDREDLTPDDDKLRYCYAEVPYVLPSLWQRYFSEVQGDMQILWEKFDAPEESAYQDLRDGKGIAIQKIVDDFLEQNDQRLLILQGVAGCGKSLLLQRLVNSLAEIGKQDMRDAQRLEQFVPPGRFIPVFYRLRNLTYRARTDSAHFTKTLSSLLASLWKASEHVQRPKHPEKLFENPCLHWLVVLDGLDEIGLHERRREFLNVLLEFMQNYPRLRVILTTRAVIPLEGMEEATLVEIAPLDEAQIEKFFMSYRTDRSDEEIRAFIQLCKTWEDAWKLLRVPVYLNAAAPSVGIPREIADVEQQPTGPPVQNILPANEETQGLLNMKTGEISHGFWASIHQYSRRWQDAYRAEIETFYEDLTGNSLPTILQTEGGSNG